MGLVCWSDELNEMFPLFSKKALPHDFDRNALRDLAKEKQAELQQKKAELEAGKEDIFDSITGLTSQLSVGLNEDVSKVIIILKLMSILYLFPWYSRQDLFGPYLRENEIQLLEHHSLYAKNEVYITRLECRKNVGNALIYHQGECWIEIVHFLSKKFSIKNLLFIIHKICIFVKMYSIKFD